ncbi:MAG: hypothetical protein QM754_02575 [Tepidisphaeraceae bacterium]
MPAFFDHFVDLGVEFFELFAGDPLALDAFGTVLGHLLPAVAFLGAGFFIGGLGVLVDVVLPERDGDQRRGDAIGGGLGAGEVAGTGARGRSPGGRRGGAGSTGGRVQGGIVDTGDV